MQAAPGTFELLEVGVMKDLVELLADLGVERRDHGFDRLHHVVLDQRGVGQRLLSQGLDGTLHCLLGGVGAGLEFLFQQAGKVAQFLHLHFGKCALGLFGGHMALPPEVGRYG